MEKRLSDTYILETKNIFFYAYLATEFSKRSLMGFAKFFQVQSNEEYEHSQRVLNHLIEHKIPITLGINYADWVFSENFVKEAIQTSLLKEKEVSAHYRELMKYAEENKHYKHQDFILWFVKEQVEEENFFHKLLTKFKSSDVYFVDKELSEQYQ